MEKNNGFKTGIKIAGLVFICVVVFAFIFLSALATTGADNLTRPTPFGTPEPISEISPQVYLLLENALAQTTITKTYDASYVAIPYPNGDVPLAHSACTDVLIRALRKTGVDLQQEVHEDMAAHFETYPQIWGLPGPDTNIDHRRVPNLRVFFTRLGKSLPVTQNPADYLPGDFVSYDLNGRGLTHIAIVSGVWNFETGRYEIIHNIGRGTRLEDVLFDWEVTGHYRYY